MRIVADENIVAVEDNYRQFGELVTLPGRAIGPAEVKHADALLVRSITRVDRQLLKDSRVKFVATATSGTDHLDLEWLQQAGITVVDAAGSNANAVMEYVLTALSELLRMHAYSLKGKQAVVVGCGRVGSRVLRLFTHLGIRCRAYDPPLQAALAASGSAADLLQPSEQVPSALTHLSAAQLESLRFCTFEEVLESDIISLHTPLTRTGPQRTWHMFDAQVLERLRSGTLLINTGRGEVVDNRALKDTLRTGKSLLTILDVWEGEPLVDAELAHLVDIATPHIAGYSVEAKRAASDRNYEDFLHFFSLTGHDTPAAYRPEHPFVRLDEGLSAGVVESVCSHFPLQALSEKFKRSVDEPHASTLFDQMRRELAGRREMNLLLS